MFLRVCKFILLTFSPSGTSFHTEKLVRVQDLVPKDEPVVFVIGAMAHGSVSFNTMRLNPLTPTNCQILTTCLHLCTFPNNSIALLFILRKYIYI